MHAVEPHRGSIRLHQPDQPRSRLPLCRSTLQRRGSVEQLSPVGDDPFPSRTVSNRRKGIIKPRLGIVGTRNHWSKRGSHVRHYIFVQAKVFSMLSPHHSIIRSLDLAFVPGRVSGRYRVGFFISTLLFQLGRCLPPPFSSGSFIAQGLRGADGEWRGASRMSNTISEARSSRPADHIHGEWNARLYWEPEDISGRK